MRKPEGPFREVVGTYGHVVDPDVNVRDINQALWALYIRVQPDQDAIIVPPMVGVPLDPSAPVHRHSSDGRRRDRPARGVAGALQSRRRSRCR